MRTMSLALRMMVSSVAATAMFVPGSIAAADPVPSPAPSVAGTWTGAFLGTNFTFEFSQSADGWTGRYRSDKSGKWADLQAITVTAGTVRFAFKSQPPSTFTLTLDAAGKILSGGAKFGEHPPLPLALTRAS